MPASVWCKCKSLLLPPAMCRWCDQCCWSVIQCVCLSFCVQDYCKSNHPVWLKPGVMIEPTNWKNWLTFGGDPIPDTDSGLLSHFPHHSGIEHFRRSISISQSQADFHNTRRNDWRRQGNESTFWEPDRQTSRSKSGLIWKSKFESWISLVKVSHLGRCLRSLSTV